jgi:hypothetical protein
MEAKRRKLTVLGALAGAVILLVYVGETAIRYTPVDGWNSVFAAWGMLIVAVLVLAVIGLVALVVVVRGR